MPKTTLAAETIVQQLAIQPDLFKQWRLQVETVTMKGPEQPPLQAKVFQAV
ncbi:hypothetical protein [Paenibacillus hexagrammi]|uniref:Uncharacterized protein n=1 Tax=Paenibacillus hexagrammi TaxID=2908839 RepID=A0ABY3SMB4_9BACL|nr:hypothetical protein [Paenibacillus sp. YPD9-1]UJF35197.1 hypothetical protein L0M14_08765 [Paenibacillus sp. YPD9-1]